MYSHLLVPLDDSELAVDVVAKALDLARALGARVTFFHARPDYGATSDGALQRALAPADFAAAAAGHARAVLAKAEVSARAAGVAHESLATTSDRPYEAIIEAAEERGCDLIFMASHGRRGIRGLMLGSQTQKVLQHTRIPVLVATVESNAVGRDMNTAVAIIKDEHRSLAAVIHGLRHLVQQVRNGAAPDFALLRAALHYIRAFPETLHHPKEESWLFQRLRSCGAELEPTLATLEQQHRDGHQRFAELEQALDDFAQGRSGVEPFAKGLESFAEIEWEHMSLEEKVILPAAQAQLSETDWREIAQAFGDNGDPRFGAEPDEEFRKLFTRILNLAAEAPPGDAHG
jgi:nucleotide-binding universal stress UspA family protein/hemerythrin-like domain-containing protein